MSWRVCKKSCYASSIHSKGHKVQNSIVRGLQCIRRPWFLYFILWGVCIQWGHRSMTLLLCQGQRIEDGTKNSICYNRGECRYRQKCRGWKRPEEMDNLDDWGVAVAGTQLCYRRCRGSGTKGHDWLWGGAKNIMRGNNVMGILLPMPTWLFYYY